MAEKTVQFEIMMNKADFTVVGYSEYHVSVKKTHIGITPDQYRFLRINPEVNGKKLLNFILTSDGMAESVKKEAFAQILAKAIAEKTATEPENTPAAASGGQEDDDDTEEGGGAPDAPAAPTAPVAPEGEPNKAVEGVRTMLESLPDKAAVLEYAEKTLGIKSDVHHMAGKPKVIEAVIAAVLSKQDA